jgi:heterodisulfide reductase subunit B
MTTYTFYPGCALEASAVPYDMSARAVAGALDITLEELEGWNCCGATVYMSIRELRSHVISARNLALAEKLGRDLVTLCNGCFTTLNKTNHYLQEDPELLRKVQRGLAAVGLEYKGTVRVRHFLDVLANDVDPEAIRDKVQRDLSGLKLAPYYGCQIVRPFAEFDDQEIPHTMDDLLRLVGADVVDYPMRVKCCGGMLMTTNDTVGHKLVGDLLSCAVRRGADALVTICPLCQVNLECYQRHVAPRLGASQRIPVVYLTQVLGTALGATPEVLGLDRMLVEPTALIARARGAKSAQMPAPVGQVA